MVPGTEGRGPEFLYVRMREKTAPFLKRFQELQKVPTVRMRLMAYRQLAAFAPDSFSFNEHRLQVLAGCWKATFQSRCRQREETRQGPAGVVAAGAFLFSLSQFVYLQVLLMVLRLVSPQRVQNVFCLASTDISASCLVLSCFFIILSDHFFLSLSRFSVFAFPLSLSRRQVRHYYL